MDNQFSPAPTPPSPKPQSFKLYQGKAPLLLQLVAGLAVLQGLALIIVGIPLLLALGLGIIFIAVGVIVIYYSMAVFRMERKGYKGLLIIETVSLILTLIALLLSKFKGFSPGSGFRLIFPIVTIAALYYYRDHFTDSNVPSAPMAPPTPPPSQQTI